MTSNRYTLIGEIHPQRNEDSSWEIGSFKKKEIEGLPYNEYPFVPRTGIGVTLIIDGSEYEVSFHHFPAEKCTISWIGSSRRRTGSKQSMREILDKHHLKVKGLKVRLEFIGYKVLLV